MSQFDARITKTFECLPSACGRTIDDRDPACRATVANTHSINMSQCNCAVVSRIAGVRLRQIPCEPRSSVNIKSGDRCGGADTDGARRDCTTGQPRRRRRNRDVSQEAMVEDLNCTTRLRPSSVVGVHVSVLVLLPPLMVSEKVPFEVLMLMVCVSS